MKDTLLSIIVAFAGYSLLNVSQASQKIGLSLFKTTRARGVLIWILATVGTSLAAFVLLFAVSLGNVSLVGAMSGSGLATLALFSRFVMKESFGKRELTGVAVILLAAGLIGAFSREYRPREIKLLLIYILLAAVVLGYLGLLLYGIVNKKHNMLGIVIGGMAGAVGGFIPIFQKVSTSQVGMASSFINYGEGVQYSSLISVFTNPYAILWIVISIVSVVILQFSYRYDQAIKIIPAFSINYIIVPLIGGVAGFQEELHVGQWIGVALILLGMFILFRRKEMKV